MNARSLLAALCLTLLPFWVWALEPDPDLPLYEKALKDANLATDRASLLKLFKDRTPSAEDKARLSEVAGRLGARSYRERNRAEQDLIRAGRLALPALKQAVKDPDIEVVRRAERCIAAIEVNSDSPVLTAAAHLLAVRRPPNALQPLLAYLPSANDDYVIETVHKALAACGVRDGKADRVLLLALSDAEASCRLAAAYAVGQAGFR